jgi:hypothetical protein
MDRQTPWTTLHLNKRTCLLRERIGRDHRDALCSPGLVIMPECDILNVHFLSVDQHVQRRSGSAECHIQPVGFIKEPDPISDCHVEDDNLLFTPLKPVHSPRFNPVEAEA